MPDWFISLISWDAGQKMSGPKSPLDQSNTWKRKEGEHWKDL